MIAEPRCPPGCSCDEAADLAEHLAFHAPQGHPIFGTYGPEARRGCGLCLPKPYYQAENASLYIGHVLDVLAALPAESVSCVVTSPPYWSLRKYDAPDVRWPGNDPDCPHTLEAAPMAGEGYVGTKRWQHDGVSRQETPEAWVKERTAPATGGKTPKQVTNPGSYHDGAEVAICSRCGAWRGQLGLEPTVDLFIEHLMLIMDALWRVLRPDGVCWINLGDGYSARSYFRDIIGHDGTLPEVQEANTAREQAGEGDVPSLLHEGVQSPLSQRSEEVRTRTQTGSAILPGSHRTRAPEERGDEPSTAPGSDSSLRREMPVLRGDRGKVPNARSHKRRRKTASPPSQGQHGDDLSRPQEAGLAEEGLSDALLELQSGEGALGYVSPYLKQKDLTLVPERFALAVQQRGWWVRSRIIWHKPNAMPESVRDRPTDDHEHIWMLTRSARYYYDQEAVREAQSETTMRRWDGVDRGERPGLVEYTETRGRNGPLTHGESYHISPDAKRNLCTVWTFPTAQTPEAHFATFPLELPLRCIEASCPREVCANCGTARVRITERRGLEEHPARRDRSVRNKADFDGDDYAERDSTLGLVANDVTTGWTDCGCETPDYQPGLVLDPFAGLATTGIAALRLGRRFIGIELSEKYAEMAAKKLSLWWQDAKIVEAQVPEGQAVLPLEP